MQLLEMDGGKDRNVLSASTGRHELPASGSGHFTSGSSRASPAALRRCRIKRSVIGQAYQKPSKTSSTALSKCPRRSPATRFVCSARPSPVVPARPCFRKQSRGHIVRGTLVFDRRANRFGRKGRWAMPDAWNAAVYRERAAAWRDKATTLPEGSRERDICRDIAQGYDDLADLLEQQASKYPPS